MTAASARLGDVPALRLRDRTIVALLEILSSRVRALPDGWLHRAAHVGGLGLYVIRPRRRRLVRDNLRAVCEHLEATGRATPRVAAAARDHRALERLVRAAFGHYARVYLEAVLIGGYTADNLARRLRIDDPEMVRRAFTPAAGEPGGRIFVGLHFGAVEMAARYAAIHAGRPVVAPMETLGSPAVQAFMERARGGTGVRIVPTEGAAEAVATALNRGEIVALVADRAVSGRGRAVPLFGAPAVLPSGPALLAVATGAPTYVAAVRRAGWGHYSARLVDVPIPAGGTRRQRTDAFLRQLASVFEAVVAEAPEQWWTLFFPIWDEDRRPRPRAGVPAPTGREAA